jgi:hypothetical protein
MAGVPLKRRAVLAAALAAAAAAATAASPDAATAAARPVPDLDALVSYETRQVLPSGVTRVESWQERLVRRGDRVWTERVLPGAAAAADHDHAKEHGGHGHKHFDFERAARLLSRDAQGRPVLRFADARERVLVNVPATEFGAVGFDGRWDAAAHLVPPALVQAMAPAAGSAPAGAAWREQHSQGWTHRVLWSEPLQVALRIDSRRDDGSASRSVSLQSRPATPAQRLPWLALERWTQREYDDFLD